MTKGIDFYEIVFLPVNKSVRVEKGTMLLDAIEQAGLSINTECGGYGSCGKCKVKIVKGNFKKQKHAALSDDELTDNIQLACLTEITDNLEVYIPEYKNTQDFQALLGEYSLDKNSYVKDFVSFPFRCKPLAETVSITIAPPTIENNSDDFSRIKRELKKSSLPEEISCPVRVLQKLPEEVRKKNGEAALVIADNGSTADILDVSAEKKESYGLAVDIGTTTVAVLLVNLSDGKIIAEKSEYNQQIIYGPDIINRIVYALKKGGLEKLRSKVLETINRLTDTVVNETGINTSSIYCCSIAGNTTMQHLFLGINPKYIREEPYVPGILNFNTLEAEDVLLKINPNGIVYFTPGISSYVGGDISAGVLSAEINRNNEISLFVDLGTNGEIMLGCKDWMTACACSAGPAFEGGGLKCGMRAAPGAVNKVTIDGKTGKVDYSVIGGGKPKGICGSAVIDILSEFYFSGIINKKGKFNYEVENERLRKGRNYNEFVLISGYESLTGEDIVVTEQDLDNLIRTKGAIWAGISTLMKAVEMKPGDIDKIIIAGALGNYINIKNAVLIGMFPDIPEEKYSFIGNGSLRGAALTLLSDEMRTEVKRIAGKITNLELSATPGYMDEFVASLFIPHTDSGQFPSFVSRRNS